MFKCSAGSGASRRGLKENYVNNRDDSLVNCDNKTNHCNRYSSDDALLSGQKRSKLSVDDESSHPINGSNTNNKSERKRNINMVNDGEKTMCCEGLGDARKKMKVDGQDNDKSKMYQVSIDSYSFPSKSLFKCI